MSRVRLDQELVKRGLARSRAEAKRLIESGQVALHGVVAPKPATLVEPSTTIDVRTTGPRYVGRGGEKLEAALRSFEIDVNGRHTLDVGASTGGFTDCLLKAGADSVTALDVGKGQLDWSLRQDPRVEVVEGVNVRHVGPTEIGAPFELVTVDVSFISLLTVAPALAAFGTDATDYLLLIKPQFEVGKREVPKGGVIRDPRAHREVLSAVVEGLEQQGLGIAEVIRSPLLGAKGNVEFFAHAYLGEAVVSSDSLDQVIG